MELIKRNKGKLIASSIVILLPMLLGIFGGKLLPEEIAVHWGFDGTADGWMSSSLIFFVLPAILLAVHWLCMVLTAVLDKNAEQNKKLFGLVFWIIPMISLASCGIIFTTALGYTSKIYVFVLLILAVTFVIVGNYMPKTTRNVTMGIKIKWTLANDENWNATHRFAGKVYVVIGLLSLVAIPLPMVAFPFVLIGIVLLCVLLPIGYSYRFYKKQLREGRATKEDYEASYGELVKNKKAAMIVTLVIIAIIVILLPIIMFTGKIETTVGEDALTVEASYWDDLAVKYEEIDAVEYREDGVSGTRVSGFSSARLLLGNFQNEELGSYTRYTYTGDNPCLVLKVKGRTLVLGGESEQETKEIYEKLISELAE